MEIYQRCTLNRYDILKIFSPYRETSLCMVQCHLKLLRIG